MGAVQMSLRDGSVAESGAAGGGGRAAFRLITPFLDVRLAAESRAEMEDWLSAIRASASRFLPSALLPLVTGLGCREGPRDAASGNEHLRSAGSGEHTWYVCSHARPTYCNVCRDALPGMTWHGLSCEVKSSLPPFVFIREPREGGSWRCAR